MSLEELEDEDGKPVTPASWKDLIPLNRKVSLPVRSRNRKKPRKKRSGGTDFRRSGDKANLGVGI